MAERATRFSFDGHPVDFVAGQSVGAALWAAGARRFRSTRGGGRPRGIYCGIGQCFDCLVRINGGPVVRACITPAGLGDVIQPGDLDG